MLIHFHPLHPLLHGRSVGVLAEGRPLHLAVGEGGYLPPFAELVLAGVLPAGGQQCAIDEVVLELTVGDGFPIAVVVLAPVVVGAVGEKFEAGVGVVVRLDARQLLALPQAEDVGAVGVIGFDC